MMLIMNHRIEQAVKNGIGDYLFYKDHDDDNDDNSIVFA